MKSKDWLNVGDTVKWRGAFGSEAPKEVKVNSIEICRDGDKNGRSVDCVEWSRVNSRNIVVDLDNNHWAYGTQLSKA